MNQRKESRNPWSWVPTLYFGQGVPYILTIIVSTVMYKNLGLTNAQITFYTGWLYLPWVIKPFWSPFVDQIKTKRFWVVSMQLLMGAAFAAIGLTLPLPGYIVWSLIVFWLVAFSSATHDIAADGFYMLGLSEYHQSFFVGIRNTFWRVASISCQGGLVYLSGVLAQQNGGSYRTSWAIILLGTGIVYIAIGLYHKFVLPYPISDPPRSIRNANEVFKNYFQTFADFFTRKQVLLFVLFVVFYRLDEAQLTKLAAPFLLDSHEAGGLALTNQQVGWAYGTLGVIGLIVGGILGGFAIAKKGLKFWLWPMALSIKVPNVLYWLMAHYQVENFHFIQAAVAFEQFGYGFGFTSLTLYMIYFVKGQNRTAHYAIATGIMAVGMMLPGMISGWIQEWLNYENFFIWVMLCSIPGLVFIPFLKMDSDFGIKEK